MRIALLEPDIPGNVGAVLRLAACLGVAVDIVEPCGFPWDDARVRRAGMDYIDHVEIVRHTGWDAFEAWMSEARARPVLMTTRGSISLFEAEFLPNDVLLMGAESRGASDAVHDRAGLRVRVPMRAPLRSLNVSVTAGIALAEALRQTGGLPPDAAFDPAQGLPPPTA